MFHHGKLQNSYNVVYTSEYISDCRCHCTLLSEALTYLNKYGNKKSQQITFSGMYAWMLVWNKGEQAGQIKLSHRTTS